MAVPKKKISKMRGRTRRAHYRCEIPNVALDPKSGTYVLPHRVNPSTGNYKGKEVLKVS